MTILYVLITLLPFCRPDIINYSNDDYVLLEDVDNFLLYETFGEVFHVTNLSFYNDIFEKELIFFSNRSNSTDWEITMELNLIKTLLSQLTPHRVSKRSINELGTIFKWITGTPDHNDMLTIQNKINELIENNNIQNQINSAIFKEVTKITNLLENIKFNQEILLKKYRLKLLSLDLQNLLDTITFSKANIINPKILNKQDMTNIFNHEAFNITLIDLLDVSSFSIISYQGLIIVFIKYPTINHNCKLYHAKAISQSDGKLFIDDKIAKCKNTFYLIKNFKAEIYNTFAQIVYEKNCFIDLVNKQFTSCTKISEKNKPIEVITDGAILISGKNCVNNTWLTGTYLITFKTIVTINNITYTNEKEKLLNYVKHNKFTNYLITEYKTSNDTELRLENTNTLSKIVIELENNHTKITFIIFLIIFTFIMIKLLKFCSRNNFNPITFLFSNPSNNQNIQNSDILNAINNQIEFLMRNR